MQVTQQQMLDCLVRQGLSDAAKRRRIVASYKRAMDECRERIVDDAISNDGDRYCVLLGKLAHRLRREIERHEFGEGD